MRLDVLSWRSAQNVAEETVKEVRREMAMSPDAPPPPLGEAPNLSLGDRDVKVPHRVVVAKRWASKTSKGRDPRTAARGAVMLMGALRDRSGWHRVEVEGAAGERAPRRYRTRQEPTHSEDRGGWEGIRHRVADLAPGCLVAPLASSARGTGRRAGFSQSPARSPAWSTT